MIKVLFICHGNICRSPMAEFILKNMIEKQHVAFDFQIDSVGTSSEEIWNGKGNPVYPPAREELAKHGISCQGKCAVQLKKEDYKEYDFMLCMDDANVKNACRICGGDSENKIRKLLTYADSPRSVADPWYTGNFQQTYEDLVEGCKAFLHYIEAGCM